MSYLSFDCFDPEIEDSAIDEYILSGEYVLHAYAESHWLEHVKAGAQNPSGLPSLDDLCRAILDFADARESTILDNIEPTCKRVMTIFQPFRRWAEVYEWLCKVDTYQRTLRDEDGKLASISALPCRHPVDRESRQC
jgi:hypothetical protein